MKRLLLLLVALPVMLGGCSSSDELAKQNLSEILRSGSRPVQGEIQSSTYLIRQGDQIQITVWGYNEFNVTATVKEGGMVAVPLVGDVTASGLTKDQFTQELKKKLAEYIQGEIRVDVVVLSMLVQRVTVLGAVTRQENYPLSTDATLIEVLSTAGGITPDSDMRHIKILRNGSSQNPIDVDLSLFVERGTMESVPLVHPGDMVFVPKKANVIRELSDFMRDAIFILGFFRVFN